MEADGCETKNQGHSPAFTVQTCKRLEPFPNKTGKTSYIFTPHQQKNSINDQSTMNQQSSTHQPSTLPKVASSKTVLKLDFRREALRDAAQMTFRKWRPNDGQLRCNPMGAPKQSICFVFFRCFYMFFFLKNISYSCCCVYFYVGFK